MAAHACCEVRLVGEQQLWPQVTALKPVSELPFGVCQLHERCYSLPSLLP